MTYNVFSGTLNPTHSLTRQLTSFQLTQRMVRPSATAELRVKQWFVSDVAIFVLKRDVKLQLTNC